MDVQNIFPGYRPPGQEDLLYLWYGIFTLWALFMMDVITTEMILSFGGHEMNGIMTNVVEYPILHTILKMAVLAMLAAIAYLSDRLTDRYGTIAIMAVSAWYILVISHNIIQIAPAVP